MADIPESRARRHDDASDIPAQGWVDRCAPPSSRPWLRLARLDRPIGTWLLLLPCWWSVSLAAAAGPAPAWPDLRLIVLFGVGAVIMRAAGCTWNDITDREFDLKVARTATRPIPSGQVTVRGAAVFLGLLLATGLAILASLNPFAITVGVASLLLVFPYPFMKRITWWPQAWLGLTFNWGALLGWAAATGSLSAPAALMYAAGFFWTLGYDTIYAHQDKEDDVLVGVKSAALRLGNRTRPFLWGFYGVAAVLLGLSGWSADVAWPFYVGLAAAAAQLAWQAADVDIDDPRDCLAKFKSNKWFGLILLAGIVAAGRV
ncbi:MAG TPA: 4-hydroxybenzoate octaprenyltransferase [Alphaproteobacteria bacterium]|nr:4-hydroxybenzoate octaprenyltransferase [Alphaproteobacteria bacterium]